MATDPETPRRCDPREPSGGDHAPLADDYYSFMNLTNAALRNIRFDPSFTG